MSVLRAVSAACDVATTRFGAAAGAGVGAGDEAGDGAGDEAGTGVGVATNVVADGGLRMLATITSDVESIE